MKNKFLASFLVLILALSSSGCIGFFRGLHTDSGPQVKRLVEQAINEFDSGDLKSCRETVEETLQKVEKGKINLRRKILTGLAFLCLWDDDIPAFSEAACEISKLQARKTIKDPYESLVLALYQMNQGDLLKAREYLVKNYRLRKAINVQNFLFKEVK